jgi:GNAT superfamily N-acetyltransferase
LEAAMLSDYTIRQAAVTAADIDALVRHRLGMFREMGTAGDDAADARRFREWFTVRIGRGDYRAWLAVTPEGEIAAGGGLMTLPWLPGPGGVGEAMPFVYNVYTEPAHRRRGLARMIMLTIHDWCHAAGYHRVGLQASRFGEPLYLELGYRHPAQPFMLLELATTCDRSADRDEEAVWIQRQR